MYFALSVSVLTIVSLFNIIFQGSVGNVTYLIQQNANYLNAISDFEFVLDDFYFAIGVLIGLLAIAILAGISLFGSGLSTESIRTILIIVGYASFWVFLSIFSIDLIIDIGIFGIIIYISLTMIYAKGMLDKISN